jgi:hypothetical protein
MRSSFLNCWLFCPFDIELDNRICRACDKLSDTVGKLEPYITMSLTSVYAYFLADSGMYNLHIDDGIHHFGHLLYVYKNLIIQSKPYRTTTVLCHLKVCCNVQTMGECEEPIHIDLHWINKKEVAPAKFGHIGNVVAKLASRFQVVCSSSSRLLSCYLLLLWGVVVIPLHEWLNKALSILKSTPYVILYLQLCLVSEKV